MTLTVLYTYYWQLAKSIAVSSMSSTVKSSRPKQLALWRHSLHRIRSPITPEVGRLLQHGIIPFCPPSCILRYVHQTRAITTIHIRVIVCFHPLFMLWSCHRRLACLGCRGTLSGSESSRHQPAFVSVRQLSFIVITNPELTLATEAVGPETFERGRAVSLSV